MIDQMTCYWTCNTNLVKMYAALIWKNNAQMRSQFCTCYNSSAAMTCANLRPIWIITIKIWAKLIFTEIWIDQFHRCGHRQAACREPAGSYDKTTRTAICFEHKTQYLLIRAPYTRIMVFWHISKITPMIGQSQISCIATIFVKYCYTIGSWLL